MTIKIPKLMKVFTSEGKVLLIMVLMVAIAAIGYSIWGIGDNSEKDVVDQAVTWEGAPEWEDGTFIFDSTFICPICGKEKSSQNSIGMCIEEHEYYICFDCLKDIVAWILDTYKAQKNLLGTQLSSEED